MTNKKAIQISRKITNAQKQKAKENALNTLPTSWIRRPIKEVGSCMTCHNTNGFVYVNFKEPSNVRVEVRICAQCASMLVKEFM